jgi:hypothetical protein
MLLCPFSFPRMLSSFFAALCALSVNAADGGPSVPVVTAEALMAQLLAPGAPQVLDVRKPDEFEKAHLPGSTHLPWEGDAAAFVGKLPPDKARPLVLYCNGPT